MSSAPHLPTRVVSEVDWARLLRGDRALADQHLAAIDEYRARTAAGEDLRLSRDKKHVLRVYHPDEFAIHYTSRGVMRSTPAFVAATAGVGLLTLGIVGAVIAGFGAGDYLAASGVALVALLMVFATAMFGWMTARSVRATRLLKQRGVPKPWIGALNPAEIDQLEAALRGRA